MEEQSGISIRYPDLETIQITIASADSEDPLSFGSSGLQAAKGDILRSIYAIRSVLEGEETWLQRFRYCKFQLRTRPKDSNSVLVDVVKRQDETVATASVEKIEVCRAIVTAAESFYHQACGSSRAEIMDVCDCTALDVGIDDSNRRVEYYRSYGTQEGYIPELDRDHLKTIVTECEHVDRLREFVPRTDAVQSFVADLAASTDDEHVEEWYEELLLSPDPEIPSEAAKALAENPDPRAKDALLQTRWKDQAEVVPHAVRALIRLGGDDVREALLELIEGSDKQPIRVAAIEGLAEFDDEEVRVTLQAIEDDEAESETVRRTARETLTALDG